MPKPKANAPKAGHRAKGATPSSSQNQASAVCQKRPIAARQHTFTAIQENRKIAVTGKVGRTLRCLIAAGSEGITAAQLGTWAFRLAAYIHVLRHRDGLSITMERVQVGRSWHGRYVLHSIVIIKAP